MQLPRNAIVCFCVWICRQHPSCYYGWPICQWENQPISGDLHPEVRNGTWSYFHPQEHYWRTRWVGFIALFWFSGKCHLRILLFSAHWDETSVTWQCRGAPRDDTGPVAEEGMEVEVADWVQVVLCFPWKASFPAGTTTVRRTLSRRWQHHRRRQVTAAVWGHSF